MSREDKIEADRMMHCGAVQISWGECVKLIFSRKALEPALPGGRVVGTGASVDVVGMCVNVTVAVEVVMKVIVVAERVVLVAVAVAVAVALAVAVAVVVAVAVTVAVAVAVAVAVVIRVSVVSPPPSPCLSRSKLSLCCVPAYKPIKT